MHSLAFDTPFIINHHLPLNKTNGEDPSDFAMKFSYWKRVMNAITTPMIGNASTKPIPMNMILINCPRASG